MELDADLEIDLSDIKESAVRRLLRTVISRSSDRKRLSAKRGQEGVAPDSDDEESETEMEKNSALAAEKKGSPAPVVAKESDFRRGDVRRALKSMPAAMKKSTRKA